MQLSIKYKTEVKTSRIPQIHTNFILLRRRSVERQDPCHVEAMGFLVPFFPVFLMFFQSSPDFRPKLETGKVAHTGIKNKSRCWQSVQSELKKTSSSIRKEAGATLAILCWGSVGSCLTHTSHTNTCELKFMKQLNLRHSVACRKCCSYEFTMGFLCPWKTNSSSARGEERLKKEASKQGLRRSVPSIPSGVVSGPRKSLTQLKPPRTLPPCLTGPHG